ncbi:nucleotidyltransferase [candidate division KSB1 bacterium]|nr:nucleotidyltransferase [candidate division KSB1 bacterium]
MEIGQRLIEVLLTVCRELECAGINYCLVGGLAVSALARPRATEDVDLLVMLAEKDIDRLKELLQKNYLYVKINPMTRFKQATLLRTIVEDGEKKTDLTIIDFILADRPIYQTAIKNSITLNLDRQEVKIASPGDLIRLKELAGRPQDLVDIQAIREAFPELS